LVGPQTATTGSLTSGRFAYECHAHRRQTTNTTAIDRLEQLYSVPKPRLVDILQRYPVATNIRWVQQEAANRGARPFLGLVLPELPASKRMSGSVAAPSVRPARVHEVEQAAFIVVAIILATP